MRIVVNTRLLLKNKLEGIGWFTYETLKRITQNHPEHEFVFVFDRKYKDEFIFSDNIIPVILSPQARHPFLYYIYFEYALPKLLKKYNANLFFSPDGFGSLKTNVKTLLAIHDLNFLHYPDNIPFLTRKYYQYYAQAYAKKATRIVTVSEFSKTDISKSFGIPFEKIDVVYNGANNIYKPLVENEIITTKKKYAKDENYFLYIGALHPRKNLVRILQAFDEFKKESYSPMKFVIVGKEMFKTREIFETHKKMLFKDDVTFLGHLLSKDLKMVLGSAFGLLFASTYEGFGIPIIEAMQCNVPVITSDITSMPEIGGNAVLLANPYSIESIKNAIKKLASNNNLREDLIKKGKEQHKKFNWDQTAEKLWVNMEKCF